MEQDPIYTLRMGTAEFGNWTDIDVLEAVPAHDEHPEVPIVLLHGKDRTNSDWETNGTFQMLAENGYHAYAPRIPGFPDNPDSILEADDSFVEMFINHIGLEDSEPILVAPSLSGLLARRLLDDSNFALRGLVLVAGFGFHEDDFSRLRKPFDTPLYLMYSPFDRSFDPDVHLYYTIKHFRHWDTIGIDGGHQFYLESESEKRTAHGFHRKLLQFISRTSGSSSYSHNFRQSME